MFFLALFYILTLVILTIFFLVATESIKITDVAPEPVKPIENWDDPEDEEEEAPVKGRK